jgi:hypothetical protein
VPHLEAILLLRNDDGQPWDRRRLAQRLYINDKKADDLLQELHAAGFLRQVDDAHLYAYHPATPELQDMIDRLAAIYPRNLIDVANLIHSKSSKQAQQFADAFKFRKD